MPPNRKLAGPPLLGTRARTCSVLMAENVTRLGSVCRVNSPTILVLIGGGVVGWSMPKEEGGAGMQ
jgi:hypothetical protein